MQGLQGWSPLKPQLLKCTCEPGSLPVGAGSVQVAPLSQLLALENA